MKLQIEQLAPYLPYNLKIEAQSGSSDYCYKGLKKELSGLNIHSIDGIVWKPILKPLILAMADEEFINEFSHKELERFEHGFFSLFKPLYYLDSLNYTQATILFKKHYDVFGLLEANLAIVDVSIE